jgi:phosphoglycolate phosphatase
MSLAAVLDRGFPLVNQASSQGGSMVGLTVFCDFDGPLVDVSTRYYSTYQAALTYVQTVYREQGIELPIHQLQQEQFWQLKRDRLPDPEIAMRSGLHPEAIALFLDYVRHIVNQADLLAQDVLQPGVRWALSMLHSQGARLVLVTLRHQQQATDILRESGLLNLFNAIRGTQDCDAAYSNSADHKTYLLQSVMTELTGAQPETSWMIGDTEADVLAGQSLGVSTIALTCGIRSRGYLERFEPTHIHSDLLAAAHYLIYKHEILSVAAC